MKSVDEVLEGTVLNDFFDREARNKIRIRTYVEGARIRSADSFMFLMEGTVSFSYGDQEGTPYHVMTVSGFDTVGELSYYHELKTFDIFALEDSIVIEIPLPVFRELEKDEGFLVYIYRKVNENLLRLIDKMHKRNIYKLENYLAYIILSDQLKGKFHYKSMTSLAAVFNVSRRNLYYAADSLIERGLIEKGKGYFSIADEEKLRSML